MTTADLTPEQIDLAEIRDKFLLVVGLDERMGELKQTMRRFKDERDQLLLDIQDIATGSTQLKLDLGEGK